MGQTHLKWLSAAWLFLFAAILVSNSAQAQDDANVRAEAKAAYDAGQKAFKSKDYATAEEMFQKAYDLKPHPAVKKSIAECKLKLGQIPAAIALLEEVLESDEYPSKAKMQRRLEEAKKKVGYLMITSEPAGAAITLNGHALDDETPLNVYLDPGSHKIQLNYKSLPEQSFEILLSEGGEDSITATFDTSQLGPEPKMQERKLIDPFSEEDETPQADTMESSDDVQDMPAEMTEADDNKIPGVFWAMAAVTGVGVISGTVFGSMALSDEKDYKKKPDKSVKDSGERAAVLSDVSFGIAAAAAITGTIILITSKNKKEKVTASNKRFTITPVAAKTQIGLATSLSF